jgi:uncharacterized protein
MKSTQMRDIFALKQGDQVIGFHGRNLEVAALSEEAWQSLELRQNPDQLTADLQEALTDLEAWNTEENPLARDSSNQFGIRAITLNVNQICNLHCVYCAAGGNGTYGDPIKKISIEKTLPQLKWLIEKTPSGEKFSINFLGGEPLLYPAALRMLSEYAWDVANDRGVKLTVGMTTNGTLITPDIVELLKRFKFNITISLDGPPEINDLVRPTKTGASSTQMIMEGLKLLLEAKDQLGYIRFGGVFGNNNNEVEKAYDFYAQFPVDIYSFNYDATERSEEVSEKFTAGMLKVAEKAVKTGGEVGLRKIEFFDRLFSRLDSQTRLKNYCGAGKSYMVLDAKNQFFTCPWDVNELSERVGENSQFDEEKLKPYQNAINDKTDCRSCWARHLCGGGCSYMHKNKTGQKDQVDSNFCIRTRSLIAQGLVYYLNLRTH